MYGKQSAGKHRPDAELLPFFATEGQVAASFIRALKGCVDAHSQRALYGKHCVLSEGLAANTALSDNIH
eukprot:1136163-Pelagomonas_calceolata.AAC.1